MNCINNDTAEIAKFNTIEATRVGALESVLGEQFGYEIFEIGCGTN